MHNYYDVVCRSLDGLEAHEKIKMNSEFPPPAFYERGCYGVLGLHGAPPEAAIEKRTYKYSHNEGGKLVYLETSVKDPEAFKSPYRPSRPAVSNVEVVVYGSPTIPNTMLSITTRVAGELRQIDFPLERPFERVKYDFHELGIEPNILNNAYRFCGL